MVLAVCMVFTTSGMTFSGAISQDSGEDSGWQDSSAGQRPGLPSKPTASDAVLALIAALPTMDELGAMDTETPEFAAYLAQLRLDTAAARAAYDALTPDEQAAFDPDALAKLTELEKVLAAMPVLMTGVGITILVNGTTSASGADLQTAVANSGVDASTIKTLTIETGGFWADDWKWFMGIAPGSPTPRVHSLPNLTHFTMESAVQTGEKLSLLDFGYVKGLFPDSIEEIVISPMTLKEIVGETGSNVEFGVFSNCKKLKTVKLPNVEKLGAATFKGCRSLTRADFPNVTWMGVSVFEGCTALTEVVFPRLGSTFDAPGGSIPAKTFNGCISLKTIAAERFAMVKEIHNEAFSGCTGLTSVDFTNVTYIDDDAFKGASSLASVNFPEVWSIGARAFMGCSALEKVHFPKGREIKEQAFKQCIALSELSFPLKVDDPYNPNKTVTFQKLAFEYSNKLDKLTLYGGKLPSVVKSSFYSTGSLVLVDENGAPMEGEALANARKLYNEAPGDSSKDGYWYNWKLPEVAADNITIKVNGGKEVGGTSLSDAVTNSKVTASTIASLTITKGEVTDTDWKELRAALGGASSALKTFEIADAPAVTKVADIPTSISTLIFPATITSVTIPHPIAVGGSAFARRQALTTVSLPAATSIGASAFDSCDSLTNVTLSAATNIGASAFDGCEALVKIDLPKATTIGENAFSSCLLLAEVKLPVAESIGKRAFSSCWELATLKLGAKPPTLLGNDSSVFWGCPKTNPLVILSSSGAAMADGPELESAKAAYDMVVGPDTGTNTDGKWYGWKVRDPVGYQPSNGGVTFEDGNIYANGNALTVVKGSDGNRTNIYYTDDPDKTPIDLSKVCMPADSGASIENGFVLSWWSDGPGAIGPILFGGSKTESVDSVKLNLEGGELLKVYGSGGDATTQSPSTASVHNITINASGIFLNSGIMAVGYNGKVTGRVTVNVTGGNISNLRGYSWYGQVDGRTSTTLTGGEFSSVYVPPTLSIGGGVKILALGDSYEGVIIKGGTRTKGVDTFAISSPLQNVVNVHLPEGYTGGTIATGAVAGDLANIKLVGKGATGAAMTLENGKIVVTYGNKPVVAVTGVTLDKPTLSLEAGRSEMLTATVAPANATNKTVTWTSSNAAVATVADGLVTAVKVGEATITVTTADGSKTATCAVTVTATTTKPAPGGTLEAPLTQEKVDGVFGAGNATLDNTTNPPKITIDNSIIPQKPIEIETDVTIDLGGSTITGQPGQPPVLVGDGDKVIIGGNGTVAGGDNASGTGGNGITGGTGSDITIDGGTTVEGGNGTTGGDGVQSGGNVTVDGSVSGGTGSSGNGGAGVDTSGGSGNITIKPDGSAAGGSSTGGNGNGGSGTNAGGNTTIGGDVTGGAGSGSGSGGSGATDSTGGSGSITVQPGGSAQGGTGGTAGGSGGDGVQNNGGGSTIVDGNGSATGGAGGAGGNGGNGTTTGDGSTTVGGSTTGGAGGSTSSGTGGSGGSGSTSTGSGSIEVGSGGSATGGTGGSGSTSGGTGGSGTTTGSGGTVVAGGGSASGGTGGSASSGTGGAGGSGSTSTGGGNISVGGDVSGGTGGAGATGGTGGNGTSTGGGTVVNGGGSATGGTGGAGSASGGDGGNGTDTSGSNTTINGDATGGSGGSGRPGSNGAGGDGGSGANQGGGLVNGTGNATGGNGGSGAGSGQGGSGGPGVGGGATAGDNLAVVNGKSVKIEIDGNPGTDVTIPDAGQAANAVLTPEERNNPNITEVKVTLNVEQKTAEKPDEAIVEAQKPAGTVIGAYFDIKLYRTITENGVESDRKQVSNTQGKPLSIRITIPQNMRDGVEGSYVVVLVHDGAGSKLKTQQEGVDLIFQSSQYSTYAIAYTPGGAPTPTPPPSDDSGDESSASNDQYDFWMTVKESIQRANPGEVIEVNANGYDRLPWSVLEALRANGGVSMVITWNGTTITIPAGKAPQSESGRVYWPLSLLAERVDGSAAQVVPAPSPIPAINPATGGPGRFVPVTGGGEQSTVAAPTPVAARKPITPIQLNAITPPDAGFEQNAFAGTPDNPAQADGFAPMLLAAGAIGCGVWLWKKRHEDEQSSEL